MERSGRVALGERIYPWSNQSSVRRLVGVVHAERML
jgi:hypothetical protein